MLQRARFLRKTISSWKKGRIPWNYGLTKYTDSKIMKIALDRTIYPEKVDYKLYGWTKKLRQSIRNRDGWKCQMCGRLQKELKQVLVVHHMDENKKNNYENNLVALCRGCHGGFHSSIQYAIARGRKEEVLIT